MAGVGGGHPDEARLAAARPSRAAALVAAALEPTVVVPVVLLVVSLRSSASLASGVGWAALAVLFCVVLPYAVLLVLIRRGRVHDRQVVIREQRRGPLLVAIASVLVGVALLAVLGAPREVVALVAAMLAGLGVMSLVSHWYKASFHVATVAGAAVVLGHVLGPWWLVVLAPAVGLVGWARWRAGRHTLPQLLVGLLVGAVTAGVVFPALM